MTSSPFEQKQSLKPFPQCRQCLIELTEKAAELSAKGNPDLQARALALGQKALARSEYSHLTSPEAANHILRAVSRESGVSDPYLDFKNQELATARKVFAQTSRLLGSDLESLVALAALGNSLDFFKPPQEAMSEVVAYAQAGVTFYHNDIPRLQAALEAGPGLLLYLSDNTGEIYFDLPLFEYLRNHSKRLVLVVKGGPALNDLTRPDLTRSGLEDRFGQVADTGVEGAGVEWSIVSPEFKELVQTADLIIAKGMANFETICLKATPCPVFHIFRVKCQPMQDYLQAPPQSFWAIWREAGESCHG